MKMPVKHRELTGKSARAMKDKEGVLCVYDEDWRGEWIGLETLCPNQTYDTAGPE